MPLPLLIPIAVAAASYSTGAVVAAVTTFSTVTGITGGFVGWYLGKKGKKTDTQKKMDDMAKERLEQAKEEIKQAGLHVKGLKETILQLNDKIKELKTEMQQFKTGVEDSKKTQEDYKARLGALSTSLVEQTKKLDESIKEMASLKEKLKESQKLLGEKDADVLKAQKELQRLNDLITLQTQTMKSLSTEVLELSRDKEALQKECDKYKQVIDEELTPKIGILLQKVGMYQKKNATPPNPGSDPKPSPAPSV